MRSDLCARFCAHLEAQGSLLLLLLISITYVTIVCIEITLGTSIDGYMRMLIYVLSLIFHVWGQHALRPLTCIRRTILIHALLYIHTGTVHMYQHHSIVMDQSQPICIPTHHTCTSNMYMPLPSSQWEIRCRILNS